LLNNWIIVDNSNLLVLRSEVSCWQLKYRNCQGAIIVSQQYSKEIQKKIKKTVSYLEGRLP